MRQDKLWVARILAFASAASAGACGGVTASTADAAPTDAASDTKHAKDANEAKDAPPDALRDSKVEDALPEAGMESGAPDVISARRPFLVGSSMRSAEARVRDDWSDRLAPAEGLDDATREALARAWLADGLEEHASIAAFARFAMMMLGLGAPPELVAEAQRASVDEVRHARACFSLARRYGARAAGPGSLRVDDALGPATLAEVAALAAEEGCVGETLGALIAEAQAAAARDPEVVSRTARIARDETRHAELAWRFVSWAVASGGEGVLAAVEAAVTRALAMTLAMDVRPLRVDAASWAAHGRLSCKEARDIATRGAHDVVLPALRAMRRRSGSEPVDYLYAMQVAR